MDNDTWATRAKQLALAGDMKELRAFLQETRRAAEHSVGPWHVQQALGMIWMAERDTRLATALECVEHERGWYQYWSQSLADTLIRTANVAFGQGDDSEGEAFLREALEKVAPRLAFTDRSVMAEVWRQHFALLDRRASRGDSE
jgi:hypothetical protein